MEPDWSQDPANKNIQPRQIPQFEVAGHQTDSANYDKAVRLVISRCVLVVVLLALVLVAFKIGDAFRTQRSSFAQFDTSGDDHFAGKIRLSLHGIDREQKIKGMIFTNSAKKGFAFLVVDVSVTNRSDQTFQLNVYALSLRTREGKSYSPDLRSRMVRGKLTSGRLKPDASKRGKIVFQLPASQAVRELELRGGKGPLTTVSI